MMTGLKGTQGSNDGCHAKMAACLKGTLGSDNGCSG